MQHISEIVQEVLDAMAERIDERTQESETQEQDSEDEDAPILAVA
jgi:hypothetical protein